MRLPAGVLINAEGLNRVACSDPEGHLWRSYYVSHYPLRPVNLRCEHCGVLIWIGEGEKDGARTPIMITISGGDAP